MKKIVILLMTVLTFTVSAQKIEIVTVEGRGETLEKAQKNAESAAVMKVAGTVIHESTEISKDEIKQKLESGSGGYLLGSKIVGRTIFKDGFWTVNVKAKVLVDKVTKVLGFNENTTDFDLNSGKTSEDVRTPEQKNADLLIAVAEQYLKCWTFVRTGQALRQDHQNNPELVINYELRLDPQKYQLVVQDILKTANRLNFKETTGGGDGWTRNFHLRRTSGNEKSTVYYAPSSSSLIDIGRIYKKTRESHLYCTLAFLDKSGEVLNSKKILMLFKPIHAENNTRLFLIAPDTNPIQQHAILSGLGTTAELHNISRIKTSLSYEETGPWPGGIHAHRGHYKKP